jgi:hypothetical protein
MNTTTAANRLTAPQPLLSLPARIAAGLGVAAAVTLASIGAGQASHQAVQSAAQSFGSGPTHVQLAPVQVVGRRDAVEAKRT